MKTATRCVRPESDGDSFGAISPPIYQTATFRQETVDEFGEYDYTRSGNPTRTLVERQIADLEGAKHACAFASGMAAITALTRLVSTGEEILCGSDLYGGTIRLLRHPSPAGVQCAVDRCRPSPVARCARVRVGLPRGAHRFRGSVVIGD